MSRVFISYRRADCPAHAGRLYDVLLARLGAGTVFMDVETIEPGVDFGALIDDAVGSCRVLVALIGRDWLDAANPDGGRRLDDPEDLVRLEIAAGLRRDDVRVIPALVEGAQMPGPHELPPDLEALARRNALELRDSRWHQDVERLVEVVDRVSPRPAAAPGLERATNLDEAEVSATAAHGPRSAAIGSGATISGSAIVTGDNNRIGRP